MPKKKKQNAFDSNAASDITMMSSKTNTLNDGVKNAANQQNLEAKVNLPKGAKKPKNTPK